VWPLVVVVLHPPRDPFPRLVQRLEARPGQEVVLERLPEPLDLPQRHRMMRRAADVVDVVFLQFLLEGRLPAPTGILPAVVGQHFPGRAVLRHRGAVEVHHVGAGMTAIHAQTHDVPGVVIDEGDDVRRLAQEREVRDVALPHLIRRGTLEPARRHLAFVAGFWLRLLQPGIGELLAHRFRTGLQPEHPPQHL